MVQVPILIVSFILRLMISEWSLGYLQMVKLRIPYWFLYRYVKSLIFFKGLGVL